MYLLSWSSSARNDKVSKDKAANFMPAQQQRSPMTQIPLLNKMKRKRSDGSLAPPLLECPSPKRRSETMSHVEIPTADLQRVILPSPSQEDQVERVLGSNLTDHSQRLTEMAWERASDSTHLRNGPPGKPTQSGFNYHGNDTGRLPLKMTTPAAVRGAIEAQFNLEVLLKHRELRLIDQEFAKCQIALEQLRRCQIFQYPASSSTFEDMQTASTGSGVAYDNRAPYAPPWGVTNGPYTRHYERWLIPDSAFDDSFADHVQTPIGEFVPERATRGSKAEKGIVAGKSRSQRGSTGARLKALPHGYPEPKEEKGPMIVKRSSDGKMVKLVCLDCRRSNFNSAQGFINHCRIAHSRQFLSHDAAIEASGEEVDMDMEGGLGDTNGSQASASAGLVHPLIRSALARTTPTDSTTSSSRRKKAQSSGMAKNQLPDAPSVAQAVSTPRRSGFGMPEYRESDSVPFNPSPQTPHLSALFARMCRGGDLNEMVAQAKMSPEIDLSLSSDDEDEREEVNPADQIGVSQSRSTRGVVQGGCLPARAIRSPTPLERSPSHPGISSSTYKVDPLHSVDGHYGYQSPFHNRDHHQDHSIGIHGIASPLNLSPNTIESHTAPSLVSDDGDYENTHSESETSSSGEADDDEDNYIHAEVIDHDEMGLGEGSSHDHHLSLGGKPHNPAPGRRSSAMRHPSAIRDEGGGGRHVSFASPVRRPRKGSRAKDDA